MTSYIGQPISRVDGRAKVTGAARFSAEHPARDLVYGHIVSSSIARGRITRIDASRALGLAGVRQVLTHENTPRLEFTDPQFEEENGSPGHPFIPLNDDAIRFSAQPVALVLADSIDVARYAASLVNVEYDRKKHLTDFEAGRGAAYVPPKWRDAIPSAPKSRGNFKEAVARASARIVGEYRIPVEHHNPMELFGTTVIVGEDGALTVYDKTQGVQNVQGYLCSLFGLRKDEVRVRAPFVGGAFGSGLRPQYQVVLAVLAALMLRRSVRVTLTRQQMFGLPYRPPAWQRVTLGGRSDGTLEALQHEAVTGTSRFEDHGEVVVNWSGMLYHCDNARFDHRLVQLDLTTPLDMRAPGAVTGLFALESAMDELAVKLGIDPVDLRTKNYTAIDQNTGLPYSSKALRECYRKGSERFGWSRRNPQPGSMRNGETLIGWGMAGGIWDALQFPASASAVLTADGRLVVSSATEDIGTGTYTAMTQIAADVIGLPIEAVSFVLGDSALPHAPLEGGSFTLSSVGSAVKAACDKVRDSVLEHARRIDNSPLANASPREVEFVNGSIRLRADPARAITLIDVLRGAKLERVAAEADVEPTEEQKRYAHNSHSAVFVEVHIDAELGTIRIPRIVAAHAVGRAVNPKTGVNQLVGGIVWGIGMALEEESVIDKTFGRIINHNYAEYHVPVCADVHEIEVILVEEEDTIVNPLGAKGMGEPGLVGVAAAIANAVYHATGRRIRDLPITLDKLL